jgi:predicted peroxiredoxin
MPLNLVSRAIAALCLVFPLLHIPAAGAWAQTPVPGKAAEDRQKVVVHLTHYTDNLHAVNMALELASVLAKKGADVSVFLDLESVRLVDRRSPQDLNWGSTVPISTLFQNARESGVRFIVCPHCAKAAGIEAKNLREGASLATPDELGQLLLNADKILDY